MSIRKNGKLIRWIYVMLIIQWVLLLAKSDAYFSCYLLCGMVAVGGVLSDAGEKETKEIKNRAAITLAAAVYSAAVMLANYPLISNALNAGLLMCGGYAVGEQGIRLIDAWMMRASERKSKEQRKHAFVVFASVFLAAAAIDLGYMFCKNYPGTLTPDSLSQIEQILTGKYSNHHPYWHTKLIEVFVKPGMLLFGDINAAVAVYNVAQILMMASCFAFAVMTLYQVGVSKGILIAAALPYLVIPFHVVYSHTVWKDILFGGAMLLMSVSFLRIFRDIGEKRKNYVFLTVGLIGMALLRNNGWLALLASLILGAILFGRKHGRALLTIGVVLVISWVMKNPVLNMLGVEGSNFRESLSIPLQQIARVIAYDGDISQEQKEVLSQVIDVDMIPQWYRPGRSNPIKNQTDGEYIREHKGEFLKLWIEVGLQNPVVYVEAWVEQTKGYWNGGYDYMSWSEGISPNEMGIVGKRVFDKKFSDMVIPEICSLPFSMGLHVWLFAALFVIHLIRGRREMAYLAVPVLMMIGTLMVATPIFCEFRYAYGVFTVLPFYAALSLNSPGEKTA